MYSDVDIRLPLGHRRLQLRLNICCLQDEDRVLQGWFACHVANLGNLIDLNGMDARLRQTDSLQGEHWTPTKFRRPELMQGL